MGYSSIIQKRCKCGCGKWPTLGYDGYNIACRPDLKEKKLDDHKKKQALIIDATKIRKLAPAAIDNKVEDAQMQLFWMAAEKELAKHPYCMECGSFIQKTFYKMIGDGKKKISINGYRVATAHALPKRKEYGFPSIASNIINRIFLGGPCGCHDRYDRSWDDACKMKVWPIVVDIFKKLYPFIHPSERKNIPDVLLQEIEPK